MINSSLKTTPFCPGGHLCTDGVLRLPHLSDVPLDLNRLLWFKKVRGLYKGGLFVRVFTGFCVVSRGFGGFVAVYMACGMGLLGFLLD